MPFVVVAVVVVAVAVAVAVVVVVEDWKFVTVLPHLLVFVWEEGILAEVGLLHQAAVMEWVQAVLHWML